MFVADKRYVVGGYLAAYKGERMSEQEALRRGIRRAAPVFAEMTNAALVDELSRRGISAPKRATKAQLLELLGE